MKHLKSKRGVALVLVLAAIAVLTTVAADLSYSTNISYHLAKSELGRLKAYYLAKSAYNFMMVELKFDRVFRQIVQSQNLGQFLGANAQLPLCQQFPMSTGLIRAVFTGGGIEALGGEEGEAEGEEAAEEGEETVEEMRKDISISQEKSAEEFLDFEGDFDAECIDENTKVNLNGFAGLATAPAAEGQASPYDQYKQFLFRFLSRPQFEDLFEASGVRVPDVVTNIGDWVDANAEINEMGGRGGGAERAPYDRADAAYPVRNGKLLTLMEAYLIEGVVDDWFGPMTDMFTVYGDGKVDVCMASQDIVESVIRRYVESTPGLPPLRLEDPEEMGRLTAAVAEACASGATGDQLKSQISIALSTAIGAISTGEEAPAAPPAGQAPAAGGGQAQDAGFGAFISTDSRYFSLKLTGQVGDRTVRLKAVVDVKEADPKKWKLLYWRVY